MSAQYMRSKGLAWNNLDEDVIAFTLGAQKEFHSLNATAAVVFRSLENPRTVSDLVGILTEEFDVSPEVAATDVRSLIAEMKAKNLIAEV